jgi:mannose-6-phosphate isomerase class I
LLIPNGTIHGAGRGNLVLEISATPYIFTFKMYDWLRLDLDGKPRSLNIERAFQNLYFDRQGEWVEREFVSHPEVVAQSGGFRIVHCPTHPNHFYDVERLEFSGLVEMRTNGSCHVLSLVEGQTVWLATDGADPVRFSFAETFVVSSAAVNYRLRSEPGEKIKVVVTYIKPANAWAPGVVPEAGSPPAA